MQRCGLLLNYSGHLFFDQCGQLAVVSAVLIEQPHGLSVKQRDGTDSPTRARSIRPTPRQYTSIASRVKKTACAYCL